MTGATVAPYLAMALSLAATSAAATSAAAPGPPAPSPPPLSSSAAWWERVTISLSGDGTTRGCRYESSENGGQARPCPVSGGEAAQAAAPDTVMAGGPAAAAGQISRISRISRISFERRFSLAQDAGGEAGGEAGAGSPAGGNPNASAGPEIQPGDLLLGSAVIALEIDGQGAVARCRVVAASGPVSVGYGCAEARAERFAASAAAGPHLRAPAREGMMTVLVYGHREHVV